MAHRICFRSPPLVESRRLESTLNRFVSFISVITTPAFAHEQIGLHNDLDLRAGYDSSIGDLECVNS